MEIIGDKLEAMLNGGDLRSIGEANEVVKLIHNQEDFDTLFGFLHNSDRLIVMRAADSIEKASKTHNSYLDKHKFTLLDLMSTATDKELKWHLAQLIVRLKLNDDEKSNMFEILKKWLLNKNESKIVRANSIQALYEISCNNESLTADFEKIVNIIKSENTPSLSARIRKLKMR